VGRTSVEAVGEDLAALGEAVVCEDPVALDEVAVAEAWRQTRSSGRVRRGPDGGRRGADSGPDSSRLGDDGR
jgi:hypothetical protein